jgi:hypothetical protein
MNLQANDTIKFVLTLNNMGTGVKTTAAYLAAVLLNNGTAVSDYIEVIDAPQNTVANTGSTQSANWAGATVVAQAGITNGNTPNVTYKVSTKGLYMYYFYVEYDTAPESGSSYTFQWDVVDGDNRPTTSILTGTTASVFGLAWTPIASNTFRLTWANDNTTASFNTIAGRMSFTALLVQPLS